MNRRMTGASLLLAAVFLAIAADDAQAQTWSADLFAGRTVYDPVSVNVGVNNLAGSIRLETRSEDWVYGAAAAPLRRGDPFWGALGAGGRFEPPGSGRRRASLGVELGAHGFLFRDAVVDRTGQGATLEAIPFAGVFAGPARIELRGGWRGHTLSYAGASQSRAVLETGVRIAYDAAVRVQADTRWVRSSEGTFPFVGGSLSYGSSPWQLWAHAGRWVSDRLNDATWGVGGGIALGPMSTVWASVRQEAPDPLYWNAPRRAWTVGVTRRLGRAPAPGLLVPRTEHGTVVISIPQADAPGDAVWIAGDFSNWVPLPMQREGSQWMIRLPVAAGVYHYAFRSSQGTWFVPASVAGRRDDGMGGQVAILVVS